MNLTQEIKEQAHHLGFSLIGVTTCDPLPHMKTFETWLAQGRHGEMEYLNSMRSRASRAWPDQILLECRSVLSLAVRYPSPLSQDATRLSNTMLHGRIASYAWGEDYHIVLPNRMQSLVAFIESLVGQAIPNRWYTDTGPLLERELAQRAGLGWIGKNTCLINPDSGSYFLLAEILLGIDLEPDQPFTSDRCGTCTRCITACPTRCILPDRTLDARRCISYLTIELKGFIPRELRPMMGEWVFGCDVCQQVCPWNRFTAEEVDPALGQGITPPYPDLLGELALSSDDFKHKYRNSPLMRAKRRGYFRNIMVALGNIHNPDAVPALTRVLLLDYEPLVRAHAAWALGQIGDVPARKALEIALGLEKDTLVHSEIQASSLL